MPKSTLGSVLINEILPKEYHISPGTELDKKKMKALMVRIARERPSEYPDIVLKLKQHGDLLSTLEPFSPGLDDLEPPKGIKTLLNQIDIAVQKAPTYKKKVDILQSGQEKAVGETLKTDRNLAKHVKSGSRGKPVQLMRMITSPVATGGAAKGISPVAIKHSYSQGLTPGEYFATSLEARQNAVNTFLQVQRPGAVNKVLTSNLNTALITERDCGTNNGLVMGISDPHVVDRYTAEKTPNYGRNVLIDKVLLQKLTSIGVEKIKVRSPMTCSSRDGVCAYCQGLLENKQLGEIGTNVGVRAAQAMSEPLVQMALDAKHATRLSEKSGLSGLSGLEQITKVPPNFLNKALVADETGIINSVDPAPQGGYHVMINNKKQYVDPGFKVFVKPGDSVERGDVLSEGVPSPKEIVERKGLGQGRKYYIDALSSVYKNSGVDIDKRHLENLAKQTLNTVIMNRSKPEDDLYAGELKNYNQVRDSLRGSSSEVPVEKAVDGYLADEYLHYTAGTKITKAVAKDLKESGINKVLVSPERNLMSPIMLNIERTPLMNPDLLAKMGFRYLKNSFLTGVREGAKSNLHGTSPWPGYMYGKEFGKGERGHY